MRGWVDNLATDVFPDDTKMLEAIAAGQCDVGIANTYYFGRLMGKTPRCRSGFSGPISKARAHVENVSGAGVTRLRQNEKARCA